MSLIGKDPNKNTDIISISNKAEFNSIGTDTGKWELKESQSDERFSINRESNERLTITSSGNVGIGTTNPDRKLEVNGEIGGSNLVCSSLGSLGCILVSQGNITSNLAGQNFATEYTFGNDGDQTYAFYTIQYEGVLKLSNTNVPYVDCRFYDNGTLYSGSTYWYKTAYDNGTVATNGVNTTGIVFLYMGGGSAGNLQYYSGFSRIALRNVCPQLTGQNSWIRDDEADRGTSTNSGGVDNDYTFTRVSGIGFSAAQVDSNGSSFTFRIFRMI